MRYSGILFLGLMFFGSFHVYFAQESTNNLLEDFHSLIQLGNLILVKYKEISNPFLGRYIVEAEKVVLGQTTVSKVDSKGFFQWSDFLVLKDTYTPKLGDYVSKRYFLGKPLGTFSQHSIGFVIPYSCIMRMKENENITYSVFHSACVIDYSQNRRFCHFDRSVTKKYEKLSLACINQNGEKMSAIITELVDLSRRYLIIANKNFSSGFFNIKKIHELAKTIPQIISMSMYQNEVKLLCADNNILSYN